MHTRLRYVVQKHAASTLHFDFRLELDGVMKSWAVPKGPSLDPAVKRLAMQVDDHPISWNDFEGVIARGYGQGTVMLWDVGTYDAADGGGERALREGYAAGRLDFVLEGARLRGAWAMVRTRMGGRMGGRTGGRTGASGGKSSWLLIKRGDEFAAPGYDVVAEQTTSIATGRAMEEIR